MTIGTLHTATTTYCFGERQVKTSKDFYYPEINRLNDFIA